MFEFKTIASSSFGNCCYLRTHDACGLIDIGVQWKRVQQFLDYRASSLDFVLVTHRHLDHAKCIKDAIRSGIDVYAIQDVWNSNNINSHRAHTIDPMEQFHVKSITVLPFPVPHDVENVGFLIADGKGEKLLYLTDCRYSPFSFRGVTTFAVEANHSRKLLRESVNEGHVHPSLAHRVRWNHMSLETLQRMLAANDLSRAEEIRLLHLSDDNSDEEGFVQAVEEQTGIPTYAE